MHVTDELSLSYVSFFTYLEDVTRVGWILCIGQRNLPKNGLRLANEL